MGGGAYSVRNSMDHKQTKMNITQETQKQYWPIGEVAEMLEVEESTVRWWCQEFKVAPARDNRKFRKFTLHEITMLQTIHYLMKKEKYTTEGAREKLEKFKWPISASRVEEEVKRQLVRIIQAN